MQNDFQKEIKKLNPEQRAAVEQTEGVVCVTAGPGTGKTQILTLRIANILQNSDIGPENILALTFTNAAVTAMRERLVKLIGNDAHRITISTFHSFCTDIIAQYNFHFSDTDNAIQVDDISRIQIIEQILLDGKYESFENFHDEFMHVSDIAKSVQTIKSEGMTPNAFRDSIPIWRDEMLADENNYYKQTRGGHRAGDPRPLEIEKVEKSVARAQDLANIFEQYQEQLSKNNFYDVDDMPLRLVSTLDHDQDLKSDLQERFQYILVDEHQDTNTWQNKLIESLTDAPHLDGRPNLFTVGDEKQSIYRFTGASQQTFQHFKSLYNDICEISLRTNYRSTQNILDTADLLISSGDGNYSEHTLQAHTPSLGNVQLLQFSNHRYELLHIAADIKQRLDGGTKPEEIAVVYHKHRFADALIPILASYDIPYSVTRDKNIFDNRALRHVLDLLQVIDDPNNNTALGRVLIAEFLGLNIADILLLFKNIRKGKNNLINILNDATLLDSLDISNGKPFQELATKILDAHQYSRNNSLLDSIKYSLQELGFTHFLTQSSGAVRHFSNISRLLDIAETHSTTEPNATLADFLSKIEKYKKYGIDVSGKSIGTYTGINLLSAHGTKGLEFDHVYIMNMTKNGWEGGRSPRAIKTPIQTYQGTREDKRRLMYVAMTRARQTLTITCSRQDLDGKDQEPSEFLYAINPIAPLTDMYDNEQELTKQIHRFLTPVRDSKSLLDSEFLRELFLQQPMNVSALNNYLQCPQKYIYNNLLRLPSVSSVAQEYGNVMHDALESFFKNNLKTRKELLTTFREILQKQHLPKRDYTKLLERGEEALAMYFDKYHDEWDDPQDLEFEKMMSGTITLNHGEHLKLMGFIDKLSYSDSQSIHVFDYKTGSHFNEKDKQQKEGLIRQLIFYKFLFRISQPNISVLGTTLDFIEPSRKTGELSRHSYDVSDADLDNLVQTINQVAEEVFSGESLRKGCGKSDCEYCRM